MRIKHGIALAAIWLAGAAMAAAQPNSLFQQQIRELEQSFGGRIGVMAKNLRTGEVLAVAAGEKFPTASAIKLPIMVEYFYQVAEGKLSPTQKLALADSNKWGGSGLLQYFHGRTDVQLADANLLMITISDNTATNLVIDALGDSHAEKLDAVNRRMASLGLQNTRLLNKVGSWETKTDSPESIRYGIGVSTPADMVLLLEKLARHELVDSSASAAMISVMERQYYTDMIPRLLPLRRDRIRVANKTGSVTSTNVDAGLVRSPKADFAIAIFCDLKQDWRRSGDNAALVAAAKVARLVWNAFTGDRGFDTSFAAGIDWFNFPGGAWARLPLRHAPYPHPSRADGHLYHGTFYPAYPHYSDSSAVVVIPDGYRPLAGGNDLIVHFHGWNNDNLQAMETFGMVQQLLAARKNAILVFAQGPWRASDSGGGKMEDDGGFRRFVEEILQVLRREQRIDTTAIGRIIVSAHSGGYRPAIYSVARGGLAEHIREIFLFDAFYANTELLIPWLKASRQAKVRSVYTEHLADEHEAFRALLRQEKLAFRDAFEPQARITLAATSECHNCVIDGRFRTWLEASVLE